MIEGGGDKQKSETTEDSTCDHACTQAGPIRMYQCVFAQAAVQMAAQASIPKRS